LKRNHRNLKVWQEAVSLVEAIYRATAMFPKEEQYGLTSQMRRAAVSVPANIAEGAARSGTRELLHFLSIATGSLSELDTHIEVARRLGLIKQTTELQEQIDRVTALTLALAKSLRARSS
jgi:four helix bundle protein